MQPELFQQTDDVPPDCRPARFPHHSETAEAAAEQLAPIVRTMREAVLVAIRGAGHTGLTDEQVAHVVGLRESTARARRCELRDEQLVVDSGRRRPTSSERLAVVWIAAGA